MCSKDSRDSDVFQHIGREQYIVEIRIHNSKSDSALKGIRRQDILNGWVGRRIVPSEDADIDRSTPKEGNIKVP